MDAAIQAAAPDLDRHEPADDAPLETRLHHALGYAVLAPSNHNTQPWRFVIDGDSVQICADRERSLPVVDPFGRELVMSCGAALFNLRVALHRFGLGYAIELFPSQADPDVIAHLRIVGHAPHDGSLAALFPAIARRVTTRAPFASEPVEMSLLHRLIDAGTAEGVDVVCIDDRRIRERIAGLVADADRVQFADPRFRSELASWTHARRNADGMPAYSVGVAALLDFAVPVVRAVVRTFDIGGGVAAAHRYLADGSPLFVGIATGRDDREAWLASGQALERMLLVAADAGLTASYLNQPIEVDTLRERLGALLGVAPGSHAQLLLRVGRGPAVDATPRRPLADVVW